MDDLDRRIINNLQGGFPVSERPFLDVARTLDIGERDLIDRIENAPRNDDVLAGLRLWRERRSDREGGRGERGERGGPGDGQGVRPRDQG